MNNKSKSFLIICTLISISILIYSCGERIAGGTEVGNPTVVVGTVHDNDGKAISKANVFLITPHYNAILDSTFFIPDAGGQVEQRSFPKGEQCFLAYANSNGQFILPGLAKDTYNLLIMDSTQKKAFFKTSISIYRDSFNFGIVNLNKLSYATIKVADSTFKDSGYISMPGTPVKSPVVRSGLYTIPILGDSLNYIYFGITGDSLSTIINKKLDTASLQYIGNTGDTLDLTGTEHILVPPRIAVLSNNDTSFTPGDIVVNLGQILDIIAVGAYSNKNHILEYQFYETNSNVLSDWSSSNTYSMKVKDSAYYSLSCRVRSQSDHSKMTDWTQAFPIRVFINSKVITVSVPKPPVLVDTLQSDTILYRFLVSGSYSSDSKPVFYRLCWDDSIQKFYSDWSQNTTIDLPLKIFFKYAIQTQARSSVDTTMVSSWSETLIVDLK